jgi:putative addiction module killer protein
MIWVALYSLGLNAAAAVKVRSAIARMEAGNRGDVKAVGAGVSERRINFGPGYRLYFGDDGDELIILLAGGTKKGQGRDIELAKGYWADYKRRKRNKKE